MKKLLITGGSGYVGTRLINYLLENHNSLNIFNYDISLYGDSHLPINSKFKYEKKDLRDSVSFKKIIQTYKIDTVLHLACISNDPTFELNPDISKQVNFHCFEPIVRLSKENGVKKFIYASTCSVYGISDNPNVTEEHPLVPITDYNKYKAACEPILKKYLDDNFHGIIIRPATICGFSEKMRFDLTVNILTNYAYNKNYIKVFGGQQKRPNLHIDDMCRLYEQLIFSDIKPFNGEIFNIGQENLKIIEIAEKIKKIIKKRFEKDVDILIEPSSDPRSYQINSEKSINMLNFSYKKNVEFAINEIINAFEQNKILDSFSENWQNISVLKKLENKSNFFKK